MRASVFLLVLAGCGPTAPMADAPPPAPPPSAAQVLGAELPERTLSLTYDDGPDDGTLALAQYLHDQGIPATFFINGCNLAGHDATICSSRGHQFDPALLAQLVALGHRVGNHTEHHRNLVTEKLTPSQIVDEFRLTERAIDPLVTDGVYLFRPPHNSWSKPVATLLSQTADLAKLDGPIMYDYKGGDWGCTDKKIFNPPLSPDQCANEYVRSASARKNGIVQMHDRNPNAVGTSYALELTRAFLVKLRADGGVHYRFVPLDAIPGVHGQLQARSPSLWALSSADPAFADVAAAGSLRLGDVDGDGHADACERRVDGIWCALAQAGHFSPASPWLADLADASGWAGDAYGDGFQLGDLDGDGRSDLCARAADGLHCFRSTGSGFAAVPAWTVPELDDAHGWATGASRWASVHLGDVDGDGLADVCGRDGDGIVCARSSGGGFTALERWLAGDFTDAAGWGSDAWGATVQLADVNFDRRADLCARGPQGVRCVLSDGTQFLAGAGFAAPLFADGLSPAIYRSIHFADVDGDGRADVCGRDPSGVACALSDGTTFGRYHFAVNTAFRDPGGWSDARYGSTVQLADLDGDGRADICGRGPSGITCALSR